MGNFESEMCSDVLQPRACQLMKSLFYFFYVVWYSPMDCILCHCSLALSLFLFFLFFLLGGICYAVCVYVFVDQVDRYRSRELIFGQFSSSSLSAGG